MRCYIVPYLFSGVSSIALSDSVSVSVSLSSSLSSVSLYIKNCINNCHQHIPTTQFGVSSRAGGESNDRGKRIGDR
jgi:hypothetical protein